MYVQAASWPSFVELVSQLKRLVRRLCAETHAFARSHLQLPVPHSLADHCLHDRPMFEVLNFQYNKNNN